MDPQQVMRALLLVALVLLGGRVMNGVEIRRRNWSQR